MNPDLEAFWKDLYGEVQQYWKRQRNVLPRTWDLRFGIFYSPAHDRPGLMIIGANPGFDRDDDTQCPPRENLFYEVPPPKPRHPDHWKIAGVLRGLFATRHEKVLKDSVVTNLLFFKSRCLGRDKKWGQGWRDNRDAKARREIEDYCRSKVEQIVCQVDPGLILVLGLATWDKLTAGQVKSTVRRSNLRGRLAVTGTVFDKKGLGIIHPTGARISNEDRSKLSEHLCEFLRGCPIH